MLGACRQPVRPEVCDAHARHEPDASGQRAAMATQQDVLAEAFVDEAPGGAEVLGRKATLQVGKCVAGTGRPGRGKLRELLEVVGHGDQIPGTRVKNRSAHHPRAVLQPGRRGSEPARLRDTVRIGEREDRAVRRLHAEVSRRPRAQAFGAPDETYERVAPRHSFGDGVLGRRVHHDDLEGDGASWAPSAPGNDEHLGVAAAGNDHGNLRPLLARCAHRAGRRAARLARVRRLPANQRPAASPR